MLWRKCEEMRSSVDFLFGIFCARRFGAQGLTGDHDTMSCLGLRVFGPNGLFLIFRLCLRL